MSTLLGPVDWSLTRDNDGHRNYSLTWLVEADTNPPSAVDDPSNILDTPGLPVIGSTWSDLNWITGYDDWAFCAPDLEITPYEVTNGEAPLYYLVKNLFTTKPFNRCQDKTIQNPLNEPPDISGSWVNKRIIPYVDRDGLPYRTSTGEPLFGSETEIDDADWDLNIEFNSILLPLSVINSLRHRINSSPLWGLGAGTIKFSKYSFTRKLYGRCNFYYRHSMGFSIRPSWAQYLADKGQMKLIDGGDATDPDDWIRNMDVYGNPTPMMRLDTSGQPIVSDAQTPATITRNPYPLANLLLLGIPATL